MGPFHKPKPKIEGDELQRCLAYYDAKLKVTAFQKREADLFNTTLAMFRDSETTPLAASTMCNAANRLVQAAHEVSRRHERIESVPNAALAAHRAWHYTIQCSIAWAEATLQAIDASENGWAPHYDDFLKQLTDKYRLAKREAGREDEQLLVRLGTTADIIAGMTSRSVDAAANDNWQPSLRGLWQHAMGGLP